MKTLPFSLLILAWHSHNTLHNTLSSYKDNGLLNLTDDVVIYFQEGNHKDFDIAEEFGITNILYSTGNIGIGPAINKLVEAAKYEHFIFCEEDWVLVEPKESTYTQVVVGLHLLMQKCVDVVKLRSRIFPGDPLYTRQFQGREWDCPEHIGESLHWLGYPDAVYPEVFSRVEAPGLEDDWFIIPSKYVSHTNNPCLHSKEFYLKHITPFSGTGIELEGNILKYWQSSDFKIAHGNGLFTHQRWDR